MRIALALIALLTAATPLHAAGTPTPEETVKEYLTAFKAGDFNTGYPLVTHAMAQNKSKEDWVKEQQWMMQMAEVKIFEFHVYPGKVEGETAYVPNVLSSQDKFLNQLGVVEYELYTLLKEDGRWKINQQQIVEHTDLGKWFPKDVVDGK
ncbi:MAG TPA: hypothetical protein VL049_06405 [Candidatus Dormibacteraeota bacterium]|nr:hypothetical protein [Candidatus Dormibacteraeota bacterium]